MSSLASAVGIDFTISHHDKTPTYSVGSAADSGFLRYTNPVSSSSGTSLSISSDPTKEVFYVIEIFCGGNGAPFTIAEPTIVVTDGSTPLHSDKRHQLVNVNGPPSMVVRWTIILLGSNSGYTITTTTHATDYFYYNVWAYTRL